VALEDDRGRQLRYVRVQRSWGSTSEPVVRFGLGTAKKLRRLTVLWPAGAAESYPPGSPNRVVTCTEGDGTPAAWTAFPLSKRN
jgi:hypothetical protein